MFMVSRGSLRCCVAKGQPVNVKTVAASMRRQGLEGISPRAFRPVTTIAGVRSHRIGDLVERRWDTGVLNRVWVSDITYLPTGEGFLYLCVVIDGCSRRVVGWAMGSHQTADLVERAVQMAATLRGMLPADLVFHSDTPGQGVSAVLWELFSRLGIAQSMGRNGVCFDNAMCESFWSTFKHEHYHRQYWATRAEARQGAARWIEAVYNRQRLHSTLGYQSPVAYEQQLIEQSNTMGQAA